MKKQIKQLKQHLKICKLIILALLAFIILDKMPTETEQIKVLDTNETLEKDLIMEAKKLHDMNEMGFTYVYDYELGL